MLTSQSIDDIMRKCLFADDEAMDDVVKIEGIINNYAFHRARIKENADAIGEMLGELPDGFQSQKGSGLSFLNACIDRHGNQWTDSHRQRERLFALGIAAGKARWVFRRELWNTLPGGLPYVSVN